MCRRSSTSFAHFLARDQRLLFCAYMPLGICEFSHILNPPAIASAYIFDGLESLDVKKSLSKATMDDTNRKKNADARKDDFRR